jgi:hypothetical protein
VAQARSGHRIRHYGLFANGTRVENIAKARKLLAVVPLKTKASHAETAEPNETDVPQLRCPCCGGCTMVIEIFARGSEPKCRPPSRRSGLIPHEATAARQAQELAIKTSDLTRNRLSRFDERIDGCGKRRHPAGQLGSLSVNVFILARPITSPKFLSSPTDLIFEIPLHRH